MSTETSLLQAAPIVAKLALQPGQVVGDFGSGGSGAIATQLSEAVGAEGTVLLFDVQKSALSAVMTAVQTRGITNVQSVWTDLEVYQGASGVSDGTIDAGLLLNVLHQSKQPKAILAEVGRMLKTGGRLIIADWLTDARISLAPVPAMRVGVDHVAQIAQAVGFTHVEKFSAGPYHWGLVVVKT